MVGLLTGSQEVASTSRSGATRTRAGDLLMRFHREPLQPVACASVRECHLKTPLRPLGKNGPVTGDALKLLVRAIRASQAPPGVTTRIVAIDGAGGAGKSSLAKWLASSLRASIIHTDDFASWENPVNWWPELIELALKPLAAGQPARYQPTKWADETKDPIVIRPGGTVVLEGVTASRLAFRPYLAYSIWIEADRRLRLQRGIDRDGAEARAQWERWMDEEERYILAERPAEHADIVLRSDLDLWV